MKICIATTGGGLEDQVAPVFGRCQSFTIVEVEDKEIINTQVLENASYSAPGGAGIQTAQTIANKGCNAVIAGNYGPNAFPILSQSGVNVVTAQGVTVKDAVLKYLNGELTPVSQATAPRYGGMGGRMGGGMGRGMGRGRGMIPAQPQIQATSQPAQTQSKEDVIESLEQRAYNLDAELKEIKKKIKKVTEENK
ncbi:MAG: NifB/NifX family molybdenum-iron cluster-binding protein [Candidatus Altiarchaeota archaeon]|nr:NifB/NifX family molybdenum-iron cluster-binding protein [Candidatus Altiarchaeota archaeon]